MDLLAALALQIEWGADEALVEVAPDRLAAAAPALRPPVPPRAVPSAAPSLMQPPLASAALLAGRADDMAALLDAYARFDGCALRDTATTFVAPSGDASAGLVWVTGPPGEDDDRTGRPASGPDGALLDRMLASIGLTRGGLLLVPVLPWRPPGGRPPNAAECAQCLPFLHRLLALAQPRRLILEAGLPAQLLLARGAARGRRGTPAFAETAVPGLAKPVAALAIPSLAGVLQSGDRKREAWAALRMLRRNLDAGLPKN